MGGFHIDLDIIWCEARDFGVNNKFPALVFHLEMYGMEKFALGLKPLVEIVAMHPPVSLE